MSRLDLYTKITRENYEKVVFGIDGRALHVLWDDIKSIFIEDAFEARKDIFLFCLQELLESGIYVDSDHIRLKLAKEGEFLQESIKDILTRFHDCFPKEEDQMYIEGGFCYWFFSDHCPAGAVWIYKDNNGKDYLEWT